MTYGAVSYGAGPYGGPEGVAPPPATAFPVLSVEIAFATPPGAAVPIWTDVSEYVRAIRTRRGRSRELERYTAGEAEITLGNEDRRFDPIYTGSPHYPNVLPMRRVRVLSTFEGVTYPIWSGFIDSWEQVYQHPQEALAVVSATDAFKVLNAAALASSAYAVEVAVDRPESWWRLSDPAGSARVLDAVGLRHLATVGAPTFGASGLVSRDANTAMQTTAANQGARGPGRAAIQSPLSVEALVLLGFMGASSAVICQQFDDSANGFSLGVAPSGEGQWSVAPLGFSGVVQSSVLVGDNPGRRHVVGTWDSSGVLRIYVDGVDRGTTTPTIPPSSFGVTCLIDIAGNPDLFGTYDEVAIYQSALSAAQIARHYAAVATPWNNDTPKQRIDRVLDSIKFPASLRELDTGKSVLQSATLGGQALEHIQKVAESEFGALFITRDGKVRLVERQNLINKSSLSIFGDLAPELEFTTLDFDYGDADIRNDVIVSRLEGAAQRVTDPRLANPETAPYLRTSFTLDGLLHNSDELSLLAAQSIVDQEKNARIRVTQLRLEPVDGSNVALFAEVLKLELTDWVTVRRRPQNLGAGIEKVSVVEGIEHELAAERWVTTLRLSPANTTIYWLADVAGYSEAGVTTRAGF